MLDIADGKSKELRAWQGGRINDAGKNSSLCQVKEPQVCVSELSAALKWNCLSFFFCCQLATSFFAPMLFTTSEAASKSRE